MVNLLNLITGKNPGSNPEITNITSDSRKVKPGCLFFAIKGALTDGHNYIESAVQNGAVAIMGERDISNLLVPYIKSDNIRHELAVIASKFYTKKPNNIAVVTGTNGKTSTADFTRQLWALEGLQAASIGTLGFISDNKNIKLEADNTSPDPITLNEFLSQVRDCAVIEGSSIGFEQHRMDGINIKAAGFTNFTRDHLDYHKSMEEYFRCKTLLYTDIMKNGVAVLNADIPEFAQLKTICENHDHKIITFGTKADISLIDDNPTHSGQEIKISVFGKESAHMIPLVGKFQIENILCALGLVIGCGMNPENAVRHINNLKSINGRMEKVAEGIFVDYAHTPDALENALSSLRPHTTGRLFVVFGCGGDRDKGKRPQMGKIANELADYTVVTDDNPRTENADQIRAEILAKCPGAVEIADRTQAIKHAVTEMKTGDILLIAGKGHEKYQIIGNVKNHFDDAEVVKSLRNK